MQNLRQTAKLSDTPKVFRPPGRVSPGILSGKVIVEVFFKIVCRTSEIGLNSNLYAAKPSSTAAVRAAFKGSVAAAGSAAAARATAGSAGCGAVR